MAPRSIPTRAILSWGILRASWAAIPTHATVFLCLRLRAKTAPCSATTGIALHGHPVRWPKDRLSGVMLQNALLLACQRVGLKRDGSRFCLKRLWLLVCSVGWCRPAAAGHCIDA